LKSEIQNPKSKIANHYMPGFFYSMGKLVGPKFRKTKWVWDSLTASPDEVIRAEHETGRDMAAALARQMPLDEDLDAARWTIGLGQRLVARLTNQNRKWAFHVVAAPVANAWALPGGFIFVTRPLLDLCQRDADEVAFVLGHEMGHVVRKHAFDRLVSSTLLTAASSAAPLGRLVTAQAVQVGMKLIQSAYSQDQELEADAFGARLAASASFDSSAGMRTLQRLEAYRRSPPTSPLIRP
jgi:predicted Zn-dependent protease